jgi:endonuclease G
MSVERILRNASLVDEIAGRLEGRAADAVRVAGEAVRRGQESMLSPQEEAIIRREGRPVLFVRGDRIDGPPPGFWKPRVDGARARLEPLLPAVGRVDLARHPRLKWAGTAWLVAPEVVVTNRHVASLFAAPSQGAFVLSPDPYGHPVGVGVDFRHEHESQARRSFPLVRVLHVEESTPGRPDVALLQIARRGEDDERLAAPIALSEVDPAPDAVLAAVGYPAWDGDRNDAAVMASIFDGVYDVKRFHPGEVMEVKPDWFHHDCSTLGGNSGSVLLDFATGKALGLHYAGLYEDRNFAVKASTLAELLHRLKILS